MSSELGDHITPKWATLVCPEIWFTRPWLQSQSIILNMVAKHMISTIGAAFSFVGSVYVIHAHRHKNSHVYARMIFWLGVWDLLQAVAVLMNPIPLFEPNDNISNITTSSSASIFFCDFQATLLQFFSVCAILWTTFLTGCLFLWFRMGVSDESLYRSFKIFMVLTVSTAAGFSLYLLFNDKFGPDDSWCWIPDSETRLWFLYSLVMICWTISVIMNVCIFRSLSRRQQVCETDIHNTVEGINNNVENLRVVRRRLTLYLIAFFVIWSGGLLDCILVLLNERSEIVRYLDILLIPLQGFINALVFGGGQFFYLWCCQARGLEGDYDEFSHSDSGFGIGSPSDIGLEYSTGSNSLRASLLSSNPSPPPPLPPRPAPPPRVKRAQSLSAARFLPGMMVWLCDSVQF